MLIMHNFFFLLIKLFFAEKNVYFFNFFCHNLWFSILNLIIDFNLVFFDLTITSMFPFEK
jgi:hypothetical protein